MVFMVLVSGDSERVEADLLLAFDLFLKDVDDVRCGVLQHIGDFLPYVTPPIRENYLPVLCEMVSHTTPTNWRPRETLAYQLPDLLGLFTPQSTYTVIAPLCFALLEDAVAEVRERTFKSFGPLIDCFGEDHSEWREDVLAKLLQLAHSDSSFKRQIFLHVSVHLAHSSLSQDTFITHLLPPLTTLATDPVLPMRIAFAKNLGAYPSWVLHHPLMITAVENMEKERTRDVKHFMSVFKARRPSMAELLGGMEVVMTLLPPTVKEVKEDMADVGPADTTTTTTTTTMITSDSSSSTDSGSLCNGNSCSSTSSSSLVKESLLVESEAVHGGGRSPDGGAPPDVEEGEGGVIAVVEEATRAMTDGIAKPEEVIMVDVTTSSTTTSATATTTTTTSPVDITVA